MSCAAPAGFRSCRDAPPDRGSSSGVASKSTPAVAIAARGPMMLAKNPQRAVKSAMVALLVIDHADRVRATRSVPVCSSRQVANTGLNTPIQVIKPSSTPMTRMSPADGPARAQRSRGEHDLMPSEPRDEPVGQS